MCEDAGLLCDNQYGRDLISGVDTGVPLYDYTSFINVIVAAANTHKPVGEEVTVACPEGTFGNPTSQDYLPAVKYESDFEQCKQVKNDGCV